MPDQVRPIHDSHGRDRLAAAVTDRALTLRSLPGAALLVLTAALPAAAQEVSGDRPGFSNGPLALAPGFSQLEVGYTLTDSGDTESHALAQTLVRYGLGGSLELRVGVDGYQIVDAPGRDPSGFADASVGLKWTVASEAGGAGADVGVLIGSSVPTGDSDIGVDAWQPGAALSVGRSLSERLALSGYLAWVRAPGSTRRFDQVSGSVALSVSATETVGLFVEVYASDRESEDGPTAIYFDGGLTRTISRRWVADLSAGVGLRNAAADWFVSAGAVTGW